MTVPAPPRALLLALLLGVLCAFAVSCGQERKGLISASRADELKQQLDKIDEDVASAKCSALTDHLAALSRDIGDLPGSVDRTLRARLREGLDNLEQRAPDECSAGTETTPTTTETVPAETTPTVPTETTPTETTPTETAPTETAPTEPTPTTPAPTTPAPTPTVPSGGEQAPGANGTGDGTGTGTP